MKSKNERKTVLIIDDDERLADYVKEYLSRYEFQVLHAPEPSAGQNLILEQPIDVVIVDWMLPGMEGPELVKRMRILKPHLPILMVTAQGDDSSFVKAVGSGANFFLRKPFRLSELLMRIRALS